ncbi:MAG: RNA polymerase sigma factor [Prevotellaceae bacterium]|nr:RNA polymerase sigma factor [Prevotellaceae bacterium]
MKNISFKTDVLPMKDRLFRLAFRITLNQQDAEDVVQETLIKIWNRRDHWDEIESLEGWAMTIARNMALDVIRKQDSHRTVSLDEPSPIPHHPSPSTPYEQMMEKERIAMVRNLMNSLPEKQRTAMQLRDFEDKSYKEIAEIMQISEDQVKINIFRARQFIKKSYDSLQDN